MRNVLFLILPVLITCWSWSAAAADGSDEANTSPLGCWIADACRNKSNHSTHPVFRISDASQLKDEKLDASIFKILNDIYLEPDATDYWRWDMDAIEMKALRSGKLENLLIGKTSREVVQLIGAPRITTGPVKGWHDSISDQQNCLYFFGFNYHEVCVTYSGNICKAVDLVEGQDSLMIENAAFQATKAFAVGKSSEEISKFLRHDLLSNTLNGWPDETYSLGDSSQWTFHFTRGKCDDVQMSLILH